ncbi:uncharacterized protein LOC103813365 isoform X1 [Serinus canaria]|uniref:uncharacterized protein LOC103813365 isoform X1 n=1 Tax=Serinus canaria TaxID=9135 RepID=UPI0021CCB3B8|nr:uncharacterized protein LOC103813365 isoform X1 [Serinus canaria]
MRSLLALLILTLALAALCCCEKDPKEPSGSPSADSIKIKKEVANAFVKRKKRASPYEWYLEYYKSPMEQMHERYTDHGKVLLLLWLGTLQTPGEKEAVLGKEGRKASGLASSSVVSQPAGTPRQGLSHLLSFY